MDNQTKTTASPLVRRNRARAVGILLFVAALICALTHVLTAFWAFDGYVIAMAAFASIAACVVFRADAIYDRATSGELPDELAVRRLIRG